MLLSLLGATLAEEEEADTKLTEVAEGALRPGADRSGRERNREP
jgi:hypothetical protein